MDENIDNFCTAKPNKNFHLYTYPVAVGLKSSNHEEVEKKFMEDLKLLSNGDKLGKFIMQLLENL